MRSKPSSRLRPKKAKSPKAPSPAERMATALERVSALMEVQAAREEQMVRDAAKPREDLTTVKLVSRKGPCPYCGTKDAVLFIRGPVVCGCLECLLPLFEPTLEQRLKEKSFIAGAMWAEAAMRLGRPDATREEIADDIKEEIEKRQRNLIPIHEA